MKNFRFMVIVYAPTPQRQIGSFEVETNAYSKYAAKKQAEMKAVQRMQEYSEECKFSLEDIK